VRLHDNTRLRRTSGCLRRTLTDLLPVVLILILAVRSRA